MAWIVPSCISMNKYTILTEGIMVKIVQSCLSYILKNKHTHAIRQMPDFNGHVRLLANRTLVNMLIPQSHFNYAINMPVLDGMKSSRFHIC